MGGYQYQSRVEKLRNRGVDVYEFGNRVLREGCFGEDVLQLQNWLAEEAYYNPIDGGFTGYFGGATKDALQSWQLDNGLEGSGQFDGATRWVYLRSLESSTAIQSQITSGFAKTASFAFPTSFPSLPSLPIITIPTPSTPVLLAAAVIAGLALASVINPFKKGRKKSSYNKAKQYNQPPIRMASNTPAYYAEEIEDDYEDAEHAALDDEHETHHRNSARTPSGLRRLTDEELQRYIAPFKGAKTSPRRPAPQRAPPRRNLVLSNDERVAEDAVSSPHGTYYGGRKVLEQVKEYLEEDGSSPSPGGAVSQRMQSLGYDMRGGRKVSRTSEPAPPGSPKEKRDRSPVHQQQRPKSVGQSGASNSALSSGSSFSSSSYEDDLYSDEQEEIIAEKSYTPPLPRTPPMVRMDVQEHAAPAPRPVAVQKPNRLADKSTNHNGRSPANGDSAPSRKSSAPPVPVVKSNRHHDERAGRADHDESDFDPNATVVLNRAVKLHKPARLASQSSDYSSLSDDY